MKIKISILILILMSAISAYAYYPYSSYVYCIGNPINYIDPDGKDALRIVDEENKTITIKATYYVVTMNRPYRRDGIEYFVPGFKASDIKNMESYNKYLNKLNLMVKEGQYKGYSIKFNLSFESTDSPGSADVKARLTTTEDGNSYGNTIHRGNSRIDPSYKFNENYDEDRPSQIKAGVTINNRNIVMNYGYDDKMNIIHEIFHTFGLDHPVGGASNGILHYPPQKPNDKDALRLSITPFLPTIIELKK